jgi:preprotein translocase subunit YajC
MAMTGQETGSQGAMGMFIWIFLLIGIMYLFFLRPQAKRQKEHKTMLQELKKGDRVLTAGGIYGVIAGEREKENIFIIKIADNVKVEIAKDRILQKVQ